VLLPVAFPKYGAALCAVISPLPSSVTPHPVDLLIPADLLLLTQVLEDSKITVSMILSSRYVGGIK
jgi:hypothetical protein